jgi:O-antigen ligase
MVYHRKIFSNYLIIAATASVFLLSLFKAGDSVGMYAWLIRPVYVISILNYVSAFAILTIIIFLLNLSFNNGVIQKKMDIFVLNGLFSLSILIIYIISSLNGDSLVTSLMRVALSFFISVLFSFYFIFVLKLNRTDYLQIIIMPPLLAGGLFVLINIALYIIDRNAVISDFGRMFGTTEHPNFLGVTSALILLLVHQQVLILTKLKTNALHYKFVLLYVIYGGAVVLVFLSGSRTALSIVLTGYFLFILLGNKKLRSFLILLFAFLVSYYLQASVFFEQDTENIRILSSVNTREGAWDAMYEIFYNNPFFGVGIKNIGYSENSILRALAGAGLIGSLVFIFIHVIAIRFAFLQCIYLKNIHSNFTPIIFAIIVGSIFEGYLIDSNSFPVFLFQYILNAALVSILMAKVNKES